MGNKKYNIGFDRAFQIAMTNTPLLSDESVTILDAVGRVVSRSIQATNSAPSVTSSLKDGFAIISEDIALAQPDHPVPLELIGRIEAGSDKIFHITSGKAVRILTGAAIPQGADAVLSEEFTTVKGNTIYACADSKKGRNIMAEGTDVQIGDLLISEGTEITPSAISCLVAGGITNVHVYKKPCTGLLATGDEILLPGAEFIKGKLFASNLALQKAWLKSKGFPTFFSISGDSFQQLSEEVLELHQKTDAIITSGGAWKGDRDLIVKVLDHLGWNKLFHRVRMGPGKAIGMGLLEGKPVFCLPGGPPSNEMAFLMIAFPAICKMAGYGNTPFVRLKGKLMSRVQGEPDWTQCIHTTIEKNKDEFFIHPIKFKSRLKSMAKAQAILVIPEGISEIDAGNTVNVHLLDHTIMKHS